MALHLKGDLEGIGDGQLKYITNVIQDLGFKDGEVMIKAVGSDGDNYAAKVMRITVTKGSDTLKMVAKIAPQNATMRAVAGTVGLFNTENTMYTKILKKFTELQNDNGIPENERFKIPICYGCCTENMNEVILLEDLHVKQYTMLDRFTPLTDHCVRVVLKNFAILHSLSFVLKQQDPVAFAEFKSGLVDPWDTNQTPEGQQAFERLENEAISVLEGDKYKKAMKGVMSNLGTNCSKLVKADAVSRQSVVQHGDAWTNNIMFKLDGDQVTDLMMIDYQLSRVSNPVCDILYMIFNCTDHETRRKHYHDWIDYYHSQLDKSLNNYGIKVNFAYPKEKLDADLRRYVKAMFGISVIVTSLLVRNSDEAVKVKEAWEANADSEVTVGIQVADLNNQSKSLYQGRIEGLIDSLYEFGYI